MQLHGFEGYTARKCDDGWHVFSPTDRQLKERVQGGRPFVTLGPKHARRTMQLGRAVLLAHEPPPFDGAYALHRDDDPWNNDPSNLRWGTQADNMADASRNGTRVPPPVMRGGHHPNAKLTEEQVAEIRAIRSAAGNPKRALRTDPWSQAALAERYGVTQTLISLVLRGEAWAHQASSPKVLSTRPKPNSSTVV